MMRWMPYNEQGAGERKLNKVMKRLNIENYNFNWDRDSCYIEFRYKQNSYRMEHSVDRAKKKGMILRNGLDCLMELVQSLEDLHKIIKRGTYDLHTWVAGMKQSSSAEEVTEFMEEVHIRYKSLGNEKPSEITSEEFVHVAPDPSLEDFDRNKMIRRAQRKYSTDRE